MKNVLIISKHEITRLRSRFRGRSRIIVLLVLILTFLISYLAYQQEFVLNRNFYTIGVSPGGPSLSDSRFDVITLDRAAGLPRLLEKNLDIYIDGGQVIYRRDLRSQYAAGALKQYLEKQDLVRIANEYDIDQAFPLRIEANYLKTLGSNMNTGPAVSLRDFTESIEKSAVLNTTPDKVISTNAIVMEQLDEFESSDALPKFKAEFVSDKEIIIPSLMNPPIPLAQVVIAFLYVLPIFFISIFFTSSFMEEKMNRRLTILLSAPITPFQIVIGKMIPYIGYSIACIILITLFLKGSVPLALVIFIPVMLFILSMYLMAALFYRTFKDQTFFSLLAVTIITGYLIYPAMLSGISDLSSISPLSLAVKMYEGEPFGLAEYFLGTTPMYLVFGMAMFTSVRIFNEEYLTSFRPLCARLAQAIYLLINQRHLYLSILFLNVFLIPMVFMVQLAAIVIAFNLPMPAALAVIFTLSVIVEEVAKSSGIVVLLQNKIITGWKTPLLLSLIAAAGFFLGEKLLLYIALNVISESIFTTAVFGTGLLVVPLIAHFVFTSVVCLITARFGTRYYLPAVLTGSILHILYNLYVIGMIL